MHIDTDIVIYAVIAAFLFARLWSVFGTRNEDEPQRPNPFVPPAPPPLVQPDAPILKPVPLPPASLAGGLAQIHAADSTFNEKAFLQQARASFTAIVEAYGNGAVAGVASSLAPPLLAHFQQAIDARRAAGQSAQTRVTQIRDAETLTARCEDGQAFITVQFISLQENILRDARGAVIGGAEGKTEEVTDVWTFTRDTKQADAPWLVTETRG